MEDLIARGNFLQVVAALHFLILQRFICSEKSTDPFGIKSFVINLSSWLLIVIAVIIWKHDISA